MRELRFVITPFCNYKCFFCHSESITDKIALYLSPSDYEFMAKVTKDQLGWSTCTLTGGEPLISPIFKEVCEKIKNLGIAITVVTNASLLARPTEMLKDIAQINVAVHTMSPDIYEQIIQVNYPLENVLSTIVDIRAKFPKLAIHLNYTVIKGLNDSSVDFERFIKFAKKIKAKAKFIDLSTIDNTLRTEALEIVRQLEGLGFEVKGENPWQYFLSRKTEEVQVVKCPFNGKYEDLPVRDVFVEPNGVLYRSFGGYLAVNALNEIKSRNAIGLLQKINVLLDRGGS
ncbi:radical SAM protein [Candidatus Saccharibacteria bacterium]|nr:radical SAM protein [Candidatus Saccharibacteria bacterium]